MDDDDDYDDPHEYQTYFEGPCTCDHTPEQHGWGDCDVDDCPCEAGWTE